MSKFWRKGNYMATGSNYIARHVNDVGNSQKSKEQYLSEGIAYYKQAIYLDSSKTQAFDQRRQKLINRGKVLYDLEDFEEALVAYTKAISFDPHFKCVYEGNGKTLDNLKRYKEARAAFQAAHGIVSPIQPIAQNTSWMYKEPFRYDL